MLICQKCGNLTFTERLIVSVRQWRTISFDTKHRSEMHMVFDAPDHSLECDHCGARIEGEVLEAIFEQLKIEPLDEES